MMNPASFILILALAAAVPRHDEDTALLLVARNLANPGGNYFVYYTISDREIEFKAGDKLSYEIFLHPGNPSPKGGLDIICEGGGCLRDSGAADASGGGAHGDTILTNAVGKWLKRTIDLASLAGQKSKQFDVQFEGDEKGDYIQFIDNIKIERADGGSIIIYDDGRPKVAHLDFRNGYSERVLCAQVARASVKTGPELEKIIIDKKAKEELYYARETLKSEFDLASKFAKAENRQDIVDELKDGLAGVPLPDEFKGTAAEYHELLHKQRGHLDHAHPLMQQYGGHLVGHAHIDLQWLWEWPEGLDFSRSTFAQVCKFMDEYPDFTFTQSSAGLYEKIEEQYPDLFANIARRVKEGRFEFVGGRWCEGDTNMISGESHARHLLYGQRYFKSAFGRIATVGWEPDTFGHTGQMPQILKLGGIDSYYFCRGGKKLPLFWWESPDGSRVLAFDEPASGSWYNSDVNDSFVTELLDFYDKTGLKNLIWVYGVGNHGGGPTREQIEKANSWKDAPGRPTVKFGTARKFFDLCKEKNLEKLPVVKEELNPVFRGCYTTHGDMKQLNNDAQAALDSAEALAAMAAQSGFPYPAADLARAWKTVAWNHHHDTLPGSGIHDSYELSHVQLHHVIEYANWLQLSAARHISYRVDDSGEGAGLIVFNPCGWNRDQLVTVEIKNTTGVPRVFDADGNALAAGGPPVQFIAKDVPAFGYKVFRLKWDAAETAGPGKLPIEGTSCVARGDLFILSNKFLRVAIDGKTGEFRSVEETKSSGEKREILTGGRNGNRIEVFYEDPHGMSAWEIGKIQKNEPVTAAEVRVVADGGLKSELIIERKFGKSTIHESVRLESGKSQIDMDVRIDWNEFGAPGSTSPLLRLIFPVAGAPEIAEFEARFSTPFADVVRPADGEDAAGLTWAWAAGPRGGAALLNDHKHGYSATRDGELRLTLVRASSEPDPAPDQYTQSIHCALVPLSAGAKPSFATRLGFELNHPLVAMPVLHNTVNGFAGDRRGEVLAATRSFIQFDGLPDAIPTCMKRAEDSDALIVRYYQDSAAAASGNMLSSVAADAVTPVNFLEDSVGEPLQIITPRPGPGAANAQIQARISLRPYEIQTLRIGKNK
ncbi:MAG: alpha-mannosidase [Planctomycetes bacterium]|nr:alpha-mannosidase [Planctomycetota bacterium]